GASTTGRQAGASRTRRRTVVHHRRRIIVVHHRRIVVHRRQPDHPDEPFPYRLVGIPVMHAARLSAATRPLPATRAHLWTTGPPGAGVAHHQWICYTRDTTTAAIPGPTCAPTAAPTSVTYRCRTRSASRSPIAPASRSARSGAARWCTARS